LIFEYLIYTSNGGIISVNKSCYMELLIMNNVKNTELGKNNQNYDYNDFFRMSQQYLRTSQLIIDKINKLKKFLRI